MNDLNRGKDLKISSLIGHLLNALAKICSKNVQFISDSVLSSLSKSKISPSLLSWVQLHELRFIFL